MIRSIVCCASNYGIGKVNKETGVGELLFDIPADMMHFRKETTGKVCVFGYNTYMSLPKRPLKNRLNIVLWDKATSLDCLPGAITFSDFNAMMNCIKLISQVIDVYISGGGGVYAATLPYVDLVDITFVGESDPEATVFFPNLSENGFIVGTAAPFHKEDGALGTNGHYISEQIWVRKQQESEMVK